MKELDMMFDSDDFGAITLREWLKKMLLKVFDEDEGFSGKRPFGNSGWQTQLESDLVMSLVIPGMQLHEGEYEATIDFDRFIRKAIVSL